MTRMVGMVYEQCMLACVASPFAYFSFGYGANKNECYGAEESEPVVFFFLLIS